MNESVEERNLERLLRRWAPAAPAGDAEEARREFLRRLHGPAQPKRHRLKEILAMAASLLMIAGVITAVLVQAPVEQDKKGPARVTFEFSDTDIREAVLKIADAAGASVIVPPEVKGVITARLSDVAWTDAMEAIARTCGNYVVAREPSGLVRIVHREELLKELLYDEKLGKSALPAGEGVVSLRLTDADVRPVAKKIALDAKQNVVLAPDVRAQVTAVLRDVPWPEALDAIVRTAGYRIQPHGSGILRVMHPEEIKRELGYSKRLGPALVRPDGVPAARVTLAAEDEDVRRLIEQISQSAKINIVVSPIVKGRISVALSNVPWADALEAVVRTLGGYVLTWQRADLVRVVHAEELLKELEGMCLKCELRTTADKCEKCGGPVTRPK